MKRHTQNPTVTALDFEHKAQELLHIMLTLCEQRRPAAEKLYSPAGDTMKEASLAVKASIRTFIFIERLPLE